MHEAVAHSEAFVAAASATMLAAMALAVFVALTPLPAEAAQPGETCACSEPRALMIPGDARPEADIPAQLTPHDQTAVLQAVHYALSEVGDGASYVWHRSHGRLSGVVHVTGTFKGAGGSLCRKVNVLLTSGAASRKLATHACRLPDRSWQLAPV